MKVDNRYCLAREKKVEKSRERESCIYTGWGGRRVGLCCALRVKEGALHLPGEKNHKRYQYCYEGGKIGSETEYGLWTMTSGERCTPPHIAPSWKVSRQPELRFLGNQWWDPQTANDESQLHHFLGDEGTPHLKMIV